MEHPVLHGTTREVLVHKTLPCTRIAIGSASVYWTSEPSLLRAGLGSNYGQVLRDGVSQITGVGVDDAYVYYGSDSETGVSLTRIAR